MDALLSQNVVQVVGAVIVTVTLMQALLMLYSAWRGVGHTRTQRVIELLRKRVEDATAHQQSEQDRATQRIGFWNTSFRGNLSVAENDDNAAVSTGGLMFAEISTTPKGTDNVAYGNFFWAIDEFASAARDETAGGPLGRVGLLFAAVGLGDYGSALSNRADKVVGGSLGYPWLLDPYRRQLVFEVGGRKRTSSEIDDDDAIGGRFQQAIGRRLILRVDAFASVQEDRDESFGVRSELQVRF